MNSEIRFLFIVFFITILVLSIIVTIWDIKTNKFYTNRYDSEILSILILHHFIFLTLALIFPVLLVVYRQVPMGFLIFLVIFNIAMLIQWKYNNNNCLISTYTDKLMKSKNINIDEDNNGFRTIINIIQNTYSSLGKDKTETETETDEIENKTKLSFMECFVYFTVTIYILMILKKIR